VGKSKGRRQIRRLRCRCESGSEWILERLAGGVEWIHLAQDRDLMRAVVNAVTNVRFWRHGVSYFVPCKYKGK
jgi:hypothetical protein